LANRSWRNGDFLSAPAKAFYWSDGRKATVFRRFFAPVFACRKTTELPNSFKEDPSYVTFGAHKA